MRATKLMAWIFVAGLGLLVSGVATAATIPLGVLTSNATVGNSITGNGTTFEDTFTFTINSASNVAATAVNAAFVIGAGSPTVNYIAALAGDIDGTPLTLSSTTVPTSLSGISVLTQLLSGFASLTPGNHVLTIRGIVASGQSASYGGSLAIASVPVPPAGWLMGGALLALAGIRRRPQVR